MKSIFISGPARAAPTPGVTWRSEAIFQHVDIWSAQNTADVYPGAVVKSATHADAAKKWLAVPSYNSKILSTAGDGFKPYSR